MWEKKGDMSGGADEIKEWLPDQKYFQEYFKKDPRFRQSMVASKMKQVSDGSGDTELQRHTTKGRGQDRLRE